MGNTSAPAHQVTDKHTPGPWNVHFDHKASPSIWIDANDNAGIAKIEPWDHHGTTSETHNDEDWANARLIAASPELLSACRWFRDQLDAGELVRDITRDAQSDWGPRMMRFTMELQKAVTAIAKAEGRA